MQTLTAAPDLDGWAIVERLMKDLAPPETEGGGGGAVSCWPFPA